jgi:hypothetical protein
MYSGVQVHLKCYFDCTNDRADRGNRIQADKAGDAEVLEGEKGAEALLVGEGNDEAAKTEKKVDCNKTVLSHEGMRIAPRRMPHDDKYRCQATKGIQEMEPMMLGGRGWIGYDICHFSHVERVETAA